MSRLLFIGDACCDSGFARCTHHYLDVLKDEWEVSVIGINYRGDRHSYPYPIYPAWPGGDIFGIGRTTELLSRIRPQVVVIQTDPWNIPAYVQAIESVKDVPRPTLVGAIAIDGKNCRGAGMNGLDHAIFWTKFAQYEAVRGGYTKSSGVVPLGVDLDIYGPAYVTTKAEVRKALGLPEFTWNGFVVGNVNRNQPRKRLDLTMRCFSEWIHGFKVDDAFLYLHVAPTGESTGYDFEQLARYYDLHQRVILVQPHIYKGDPEEMLAKAYQSFDIQITTTQGEGWGLTTMEGMACGIPQILPDWAALGEWAKPAALMVSCEETIATPNKINCIGGTPRGADVVAAIDRLYRQPVLRGELSDMGLALAREDRFRWPNIAAAFAAEVRDAERRNS